MEVSSFFRAWLRNSKTFVSPCTVAPYGLRLEWCPDCKPEPRPKESIGWTRVAGRGHPGGVSQSANSGTAGENRCDPDSQAWRQADNAALASGRHFPQQVPTPSSRVRSRKLLAPPLTAVRICRSETALQTHTIMVGIVNANANDCQYRIHDPSSFDARSSGHFVMYNGVLMW
jgi:hypothetical protein